MITKIKLVICLNLFLINFIHAQPDSSFNKYLLRAVDSIDNHWSNQGYSLKAAFTHDIKLGPIKLSSTHPPKTMCVAAQFEIMVTALNMYAEETGDTSFFNYLPSKHWSSVSGGKFKDMVWVNSGSFGTAYALEKYGMGQMISFDKLTPGCFINLNRQKSGHAVLFVSYLDAKGAELPAYSNKVKGFKYYSSQGGSEPGNGGFSYRYAFFGDLKPALTGGKRRDCGIIFSPKQKLLNCGYMLMPGFWNAQSRDKTLAEIAAKEKALKEEALKAKALKEKAIKEAKLAALEKEHPLKKDLLFELTTDDAFKKSQ